MFKIEKILYVQILRKILTQGTLKNKYGDMRKQILKQSCDVAGLIFIL